MKTAARSLSIMLLVMSLVNSASASEDKNAADRESSVMDCPVDGIRKSDLGVEGGGVPKSHSGPNGRAREWLQHGRVLSQQGDPDGAIEAFHEVLHLTPKSAEAYRELGKVLLDKHEWRRATEAFQASLRFHRGDSQTYYWLGRSLLAQRSLVGAEEALMRALDFPPQEAETFCDLRLARMAQGKVSGAKEALLAAIQVQPGYAEAHSLLEMLQAKTGAADIASRAAAHVLNDKFRTESFR